jgi:site-specific recombinase XerD
MRIFGPIAKAIGISRLSWHVFRYSHATFTASIGMAARDRQALMGHGSIDQTDRYTVDDHERMRAGLGKIAGMILGSSERVM